MSLSFQNTLKYNEAYPLQCSMFLVSKSYFTSSYSMPQTFMNVQYIQGTLRDEDMNNRCSLPYKAPVMCVIINLCVLEGQSRIQVIVSS